MRLWRRSASPEPAAAANAAAGARYGSVQERLKGDAQETARQRIVMASAIFAMVFVVVGLRMGYVSLLRDGAEPTQRVAARGGSEKAEGKVVFISPMLDKETRSARVMAEIDNKDGAWRPGSFVTAAIAFDEKPVPLAVPVGAIQTMGTGPVAFVRTAEGFEKRPLVIGQSDDRLTEVVSGLRSGETIAVSNTFLLKAEMLKGQDED